MMRRKLLTTVKGMQQGIEPPQPGNAAAFNVRVMLGVYALCPQEILVGEAVKLWRRTETVRSGRVRYDWTAMSPEAIRQTVSRILSMLDSCDRAGLKAALARLTRLPARGVR